MAHFPQPHSNLRATRVHVTMPVSFSLSGKRMPAVLQAVSTTGGRVQMARPLPLGTLAELVVDTNLGRVCGLVEFLEARTKENPTQAFRFVAFSDDDYERLSGTILGQGTQH